jgi:hypothetical protein
MSEPAPVPRPTRRDALRLLLAGAALALVPAARPRGASAARQWCRVDPVVRIGGHTAHVYVSAYVRNMRQARELATGPTRIVVRVPAGVPCRLVACDDGFGFGYNVTFEAAGEAGAAGPPPGPIPVRVRALVPMADGAVPVRARFVPVRPGLLKRGGGEGTANGWVAFDAPPGAAQGSTPAEESPADEEPPVGYGGDVPCGADPGGTPGEEPPADGGGDLDGDGLDAAQEAALGTDPGLADTDGDGALDGEEVAAGTDPLAADAPVVEPAPPDGTPAPTDGPPPEPTAEAPAQPAA